MTFLSFKAEKMRLFFDNINKKRHLIMNAEYLAKNYPLTTAILAVSFVGLVRILFESTGTTGRFNVELGSLSS